LANSSLQQISTILTSRHTEHIQNFTMQLNNNTQVKTHCNTQVPKNSRFVIDTAVKLKDMI